MTQIEEYDAIVVGGGPAGSTAAAVLAGHGRRVVVLEKEKFPRYHIGESLLPFCYFPLERIGLLEKMKAAHFPRKYAVQFVSMNGKVSIPFYFFKHFDHEAAVTWQVLRSEFDQMLLENARERGAVVHEETEALELVRAEGCGVTGVRANMASGGIRELRAPVTIDASGRAGIAAKENAWRRPDPQLNKVALWTYFKGALRDPGIDEGTTTVAYVPHKGWFWYIPLPDDVVSCGVVAERDYLFDGTRELAEIYWREVRKNAWIEEHLAPGKQSGEYRVTKEYSYRAEHAAEDGLVMAGDAFAFLDPVFSSGVYLALRSGELAADAAHAALEQGSTATSAFAAYAERVCYEIESMRKLVYAFYDEGFSFGRLVKAHPDLCGDLTDCLIGNLNKDFTRLFAAVAEQAAVPPPLAHGRVQGKAESGERRGGW